MQTELLAALALLALVAGVAMSRRWRVWALLAATVTVVLAGVALRVAGLAGPGAFAVVAIIIALQAGYLGGALFLRPARRAPEARIAAEKRAAPHEDAG